MKQGNLTEPLDAANRENDVADGLNATSFMAEEIDLEDGIKIRPCIARYFRDGCQRGLSPIGRNPAAFIISVHLRWLKYSRTETRGILGKWNRKNQPGLTNVQLDRVVENVYKKTVPHKYSCDHIHLTPTCIGKDRCSWANIFIGVNQNKALHSAFITKGWAYLLTNCAKLIYLTALPILEGRSQVGSGGRIFAGYRDIAIILGWKSHSAVGRYLNELSKFRLISYKPGSPLCKNKKATEIRRTIPCPDIPDIYRPEILKIRAKLCSQY